MVPRLDNDAMNTTNRRNKDHLFFILFIFLSTCRFSGFAQIEIPKYQPQVTKAFYQTIVTLDSLFFDAYNHCNIPVMDSLISEDLEFYHDKGGFSNSKKETIEAVKRNICGKVTRELLPGSIEVYEIKGYGAVEIGFHGFRNNREKESGPIHYSKFVHIWRFQNSRWKITRVISLH